MRILLGFIAVALGFAIVVKSEWLLNNFGRIGFFEDHMGTEGGSRLGYKLIGMIVIFIGIMMVTNLINGLLNWILSPLLQYYR